MVFRSVLHFGDDLLGAKSVRGDDDPRIAALGVNGLHDVDEVLAHEGLAARDVDVAERRRNLRVVVDGEMLLRLDLPDVAHLAPGVAPVGDGEDSVSGVNDFVHGFSSSRRPAVRRAPRTGTPFSRPCTAPEPFPWPC